MKRFYIAIFLMMIILRSSGQDIHFSQLFAAPLLVNPAQTGRFNEQLRAGMVYRNQGAAITIPYKTYSASADGVLNPPFLGLNNTLGVGAVVYHDNAGNGSLQQTTAYLSASLHKGLNRMGTWVGSMGFAVGLGNRSVDFTKLVFGSQWNGTAFDTSLYSGEKYSTSSFFYLDLNVGVMLSGKIGRKTSFNTGVSLNHLNKPYETFYSGSNHLEWKWIVHGNVQVVLNDFMQIEPGAIWYSMNTLDELNAGSNFRFGKGSLQMIAGLWYRVGRNIIPVIGAGFKNYTLIMSYDVTVSQLNRADNYSGGFEVSLFGTFNVRKERCDNVKF